MTAVPVIDSGFFAGLPDSHSKEYQANPGNWTGPSAKGKPTSAHKAKAKALLAGNTDVDPDSIDNPQVRQAYLDQLHEEQFGEKPSYRRESAAERADRERQEQGLDGGSSTDSDTPGRAVRGGSAGAARGTRSPSRPSSSSSPSWSPSSSDGTGALLGLLLYALGLNYLRYGPAGIKGWLSAKFLNKPDTTLTRG